MLLDNLTFFFIFGFFGALLITAGAIWLTGSFVNPLVLNAPYIGLSGCFVGLAYLVPNSLTISSAIGFVAFLVGLGLGLIYFKNGLNRPTRFKSPLINDSFQARLQTTAWLGLGLFALILIANLGVNVLRSGLSLQDIASMRFVARENNRLLFQAAFWLKPFIFFAIAVLPLRKAVLWGGIVFMLSWGTNFLLGSKGVVFALTIDVLTCVFFRAAFDSTFSVTAFRKIRGSLNLKTILIAGVGGILMIPIAPFILMNLSENLTYSQAFSALTMRLLYGFDSVFFATEAGIRAGEKGLSLTQLWLSSPLKVLGLFNSPFNGINHFIMATYYGGDPSLIGMFPNNFLVMEVVITMGSVLSVFILFLLGLGYGLAISILVKRRMKSSLAAILWVWLMSNPYIFLIDGQSFWGTMMIFIPSAIAVAVFAMLISPPGQKNRVKRAVVTAR
jgi:hypothetical protein